MNNKIYQFADFLLEPAERRFQRAGQRIALTPKVFDTLVLLVERAGHVVSKEDLIHSLWPRGYVDESNLTKHIWLIRRALGEGDSPNSAIETVSKVGYRFVTPVAVSDAQPAAPAVPAAAALGAPPRAVEPALAAPVMRHERAFETEAAVAEVVPPAIRKRDSPWSRVVLATLLGVAAATAAWLMGRHTPTDAPRGRTFALVGFTNLSGGAQAAWIAPALTEMLDGELSVANDIEVIPNELVRDASTDLSAPSAAGYSHATLDRLRRRLHADYIVSGSYVVASSADDAPLHLDVALQNTRTGALVASVSRRAVLHELIAAASQIGAELRGTVSQSATDAQDLSHLANLHPPSVDVARRIGYALEAVEHYDPARARDELLEAIAESPGYAPAYTYLSQAWSALGYRAKALAAAEQAATHSGDLPREQQLQAQAMLTLARGETGKAALLWQTLAKLRPQDVDYHLQEVDAQIAASMPQEAHRTLEEVKRLAPTDVRVMLAAARLAEAFEDPEGAARSAATALAEAQRRDATGLVADSQVALAQARMRLNQNVEARTGLEQAIIGYRAIHNPHGEATARNALAASLNNLRQNQAAREEFQRAMTLYQSIGDLAGVAEVYRNLCDMLWLAGDRDAAQAAARQVLDLSRETGDVPAQSWALQALATVQTDEAASDDALAEYREVVALNTRTGHQTAWPLTNVADILRLRGQLGEARETCARANAEAQRLTDPQFAVFAGYTCALIEFDLGHIEDARRDLQKVGKLAQAPGSEAYVLDSQMVLAQTDMDAGRWPEACAGLERASQGFAAAEERTGEADAAALLAQCESGRGHFAARDRALARARELRRSITSRQEVYAVDIITTSFESDGAEAVRKLRELAADAGQRHFVGWELEARLAAWRVARARGLPGAEHLRAEALAGANRYGYGRLRRFLEQEWQTRPASPA